MRLALNDRDLWRRFGLFLDDANNPGGTPPLFIVIGVVDHLASIPKDAEPLAFDDGKVCEDILPIGTDNEPEPFSGIEPFDDAFGILNFLWLLFTHLEPQQ